MAPIAVHLLPRHDIETEGTYNWGMKCVSRRLLASKWSREKLVAVDRRSEVRKRCNEGDGRCHTFAFGRACIFHFGYSMGFVGIPFAVRSTALGLMR